MALNIKSPEAEQVVRDLARRTGLSITQAVQLAAEEKLRQIDEDRAARRQTLSDIMERARLRPRLDGRTAEDILGYDDKGTFG